MAPLRPRGRKDGRHSETFPRLLSSALKVIGVFQVFFFGGGIFVCFSSFCDGLMSVVLVSFVGKTWYMREGLVISEVFVISTEQSITVRENARNY